MPREQIIDLVPHEWKDRKSKGLCPVCGKSKKDFEKYQRVYCCGNHESEYWSKILTWNSLREKILERDKSKCQICGSVGHEIDHIIAITNGGEMWNLNNLRTLCSSCHKIKTKSDLKLKVKSRHIIKMTNGNKLIDY